MAEPLALAASIKKKHDEIEKRRRMKVTCRYNTILMVETRRMLTTNRTKDHDEHAEVSKTKPLT